MKSSSSITKVGKTTGVARWRILKNLMVVCVGFLLQFIPDRGLVNLQSSMNTEEDAGVVSLAILEGALCVSSLFLPKLVIRKCGCKATMVVAILLYVPWVAANLLPTMDTLAPTAALMGIVSAPMWSANCKYINEISAKYSIATSQPLDVVTTRFFGTFFMIFQSSQIFGNLATYLLLRPSNEVYPANSSYYVDANKYENVSLSVTDTCGFGHCGGESVQMRPPSKDQRLLLVSIFVCLNVLGGLVVALFLDPLEEKGEEVQDESTFSRAIATFRHLKKPEQQLLVPISIFCGFEQAFVQGEFTKAYVACSWGIYEVGLVFIFYGVVNASMSYFSGYMARFMPRYAIVTVAAVANATACVGMWLWEPTGEEYVSFFVIIGLFGFSDAIWLTQTNSLYAILFRSEEEAAFSNYRFWESVGYSASFGLSTLLCLPPKMYLMAALMGVGYVGFLLVQHRGAPEIRTFTARLSLIPTQ